MPSVSVGTNRHSRADATSPWTRRYQNPTALDPRVVSIRSPRGSWSPPSVTGDCPVVSDHPSGALANPALLRQRTAAKLGPGPPTPAVAGQGRDRCACVRIAHRMVRVVHTPAPPLLPLFRSAHQAELLALVLINPDTENSLSDLARRLGVHHATVNREVDRLESAGLLRSRRVGNLRLVQANPESPILPEVKALVLKAVGPAHIVAQELNRVPGIQAAWIYGSWAERAAGQPGPPPQDVDVLVIGSPDRNAVHRAARAAEERLGLDVNALVRSPEAWARPEEGFLITVRSGALVPVPLAEKP